MVKSAGITSGGLLAFFERAANVGTVIKTLGGLVVGLVGVSAAVYQYFAKESELQELQCSVIDQGEINNEVIHASQEVRTALTVLKQNLDSKPSPTTTQAIAQELSRAIGNIQAALDKIDATRLKIQSESIKGHRKC